jgi:hypothetical protein
LEQPKALEKSFRRLDSESVSMNECQNTKFKAGGDPNPPTYFRMTNQKMKTPVEENP